MSRPHEIGDLVAAAKTHLLAGRLQEAEYSANAALEDNPENTEALNLLGVLANRRNAATDAIEKFKKAVRLAPKEALYAYNLAGTLAQLERYDEALPYYDLALILAPENADILSGRAYCHVRLCRFEAAMVDAQAALTINPTHVDALLNLGAALLDLKKVADSIEIFRRATQVARSDHRAHHQLGVALQDGNDYRSALTCFDQALVLHPSYWPSLLHRGASLHVLGRYEEAVEAAEAAIAADPTHAVAYSNKALALHHLFRDEEAIPWFDAALRRDSRHAQTYADRGHSKFCVGDYLGAEADYRRSLDLDPDRALTHVNLAVLLLLRGDYKAGLTHYERRLQLGAPYVAPRRFETPVWTGETTRSSSTVFVYAEQGYGDTIQFCRYIPMLAERGHRIVFEVQPPLAPLMESLPGTGEITRTGDPIPPHDARIALLSLAHRFRTTFDIIPAPVGYLSPPGDALLRWRSNLRPTDRPRVGLVWRGRATHLRDKQRSLPLEQFARLLVDGVEYHALQPDIPSIGGLPIFEHGDALHDFGETAALCKELDLIISVDTSVAHLAGALGKPVWLLLPYVPDWRWSLETDRSPWYPTVRLFRQHKLNDWDGVIENVRTELRSWTLCG